MNSLCCMLVFLSVSIYQIDSANITERLVTTLPAITSHKNYTSSYQIFDITEHNNMLDDNTQTVNIQHDSTTDDIIQTVTDSVYDLVTQPQRSEVNQGRP